MQCAVFGRRDIAMAPRPKATLPANNCSGVGANGWQHGRVTSGQKIFTEKEIVVAVVPGAHATVIGVTPQLFNRGRALG